MVDAHQGDALGTGAVGALVASPARTRARFSRTLSPGRWQEYRSLLERASQEGYTIVSLERWLAGDQNAGQTLILRHDVDQCPRSALRMLSIERWLGVTASWYFRWRTARPRLIKAVRAAGGEVGLHYETLSRMTLEARVRGDHVQPEELLEPARKMLARELIAFSILFGPTRSACAHGDTRVGDVNNAVLLRGVPLADYRLEFDANASMRSRHLALWLTDRSSAEGSWRDDLDALEIIESHASPVLLLTHPNNWISGAGLWRDRIAAAVLPEPDPASGRPLRTASDTPPVSL